MSWNTCTVSAEELEGKVVVSRDGSELQKVEVVWLDAWSDDGHIVVEAASHLAPVERHNVGYLVADEGRCIVLTQGYLDSSFIGQLFLDGVMVIPWSMIQKVTPLEG